jgi:integrase
MMNFNADAERIKLLEWAGNIESASVSDNTKNTYNNQIQQYEKYLKYFKDDPPAYPISINSMLMFLGHCSLDSNFQYSTMRLAIAAFAYHFRINDLPDLTKAIRFKVFTGLKKSHIQIQDDILVITLNKSKVDQFGIGTKVLIHDNGKPYSVFKFIQYLTPIGESEKVFPKSTATYTRHLRQMFDKLNLPSEHYSSHSFRRGGAYMAAKKGVPDSVIKAHGRWRSECYQRYVRVDNERAGLEISSKL